MKFGGEFDFEIQGKKTKCVLNLTTLGEVIEETNMELSEILEGIQTRPLYVLPKLLWHGVNVAAWQTDTEPEWSQRQFTALLGSLDWEVLTPKIVDTLASDEDKEEAKKKTTRTAKKAN